MVNIKGFGLDKNGDVSIKNNQIVMTDGYELIRQKVQKVLTTNKKEWFGNEDEGINFQNILKKGVTEDEIKSEILDGLIQVDNSFILTDFNMSLDASTRKLNVSFKATNMDGKTIEINQAIN